MRAPDFWYRNDLAARALSSVLAPLGGLYGASVAWKHARISPYRARASVICVGNLSAGGTGKTPVAIALAGLLQHKGLRVVFLTRGYGRSTTNTFLVEIVQQDSSIVGDEALLLALCAPTIVARNRAEGARLADAQKADVILMDDGHQNFTLAKDVSFVVVDAASGFGNGRVMPAGPLREPASQGLARANAVILMGEGLPTLPDFDGPVVRARLDADARFAGRRVIAFAGIGRPEKFFSTLRTQGAVVVETHAFADHHGYSEAEIVGLRGRAERESAMLVTTEKDFVRLAPHEREGIFTLPVRAVFENQKVLDTLLASATARS